MFRRLPSSLPQDVVVEADLEKLGYFVNDNDQIRMIRDPELKYHFRINRSERVNEVYKEALNACVRKIVEERLCGLDLHLIRLPLGAEQHEKHIPTYVSKSLSSKKRILVIFGERRQELGILSYRTVGEEGIKVGSIQELVHAVTNSHEKTSTDQAMGVIVANPGQLVWYRGGGRAISDAQYHGLPRKSAVHEAFRIDPERNRVTGNADYMEHVKYVFENVMTGVASQDAKFDIVGLEYTGDAVVHYLADNWNLWKDRINGICLGNPQFKLRELIFEHGETAPFIDFLASRVRAYFVSDQAVEAPIPGREEIGCNCYASGERLYEEGILVRSWPSMLDWFNMISVVQDYREPIFATVDLLDENDLVSELVSTWTPPTSGGW